MATRPAAAPEPTIRWIDDGCVGADCGCGEKDLLISDWHSTTCPHCKRIYILQQHTWIEESDEEIEHTWR